MKNNMKVFLSMGLCLMVLFSFASTSYAVTCESSPYKVERGDGKCIPPYTCMISGAGPHPYYVVPVTEYYRCWKASGTEYEITNDYYSYEGCC